MAQSIKLDLLKLPGAFVTNLKGKTAIKQCLVIPMDDAPLFVGEKGVYLDLIAHEVQNSRFGDSHLVKQALSKERAASMTDEQKKNMPIIGTIKQLVPKQMAIVTEINGQTAVENPDDLPF